MLFGVTRKRVLMRPHAHAVPHPTHLPANCPFVFKAATMMAPSPPAGETRGACEFSPPPAGYPAADYYAPPPPPLYSQARSLHLDATSYLMPLRLLDTQKKDRLSTLGAPSRLPLLAYF